MSLLASCAAGPPDVTLGTAEAAIAAPAAVRISEFHYDNVSTDSGEAIEVSAPAGTSFAGWTLALYNAAASATQSSVYTTSPLGALPVIGCPSGGRQIVVVQYPSNGIQNGDPDGIALVNPSGVVVQFLSYEGTFTPPATSLGGPAGGMTSTDIGVREDNGTTPIGTSLQYSARDALTVPNSTGWSGPKPNTFGVVGGAGNYCNDDDEPPPPAEVASVTVEPTSATVIQGETKKLTATAFDAGGQPIVGVAFSWTTSDASIATVDATGLVAGSSPGAATITATAANGMGASASITIIEPPPPPPPPETRVSEIHYDNLGTDVDESIEIEGPAGTDLTGWKVVLYNGGNGAAYGTRELSGTIPAGCGGRGVVALLYPQDGLQNGSPDGLALVDAGGQVVELLSYEGVFAATDGPALGMTTKDIGAAEVSSRAGLSLQRLPDGQSWSLAPASVGLCNGVPPPIDANTKVLSFTGRVTDDPALPVGYEDQLFASMVKLDGTAVPTTFSWSSESPLVASIDQNGVFHALTAGTAVLRATAADGTTGTVALATRVAVASTTASYIGNADFGEPTDADPSDDYILRYEQYTTSFNPQRGTPNWVAYEIDPSDYGPEDRCDCFTFDEALPFARYTTADYTGAGAFHGYGIDRGHLARSFDRTSASLDNARTFNFSNIVPQAADLNQGPWAIFENYLGDLARTGGKEVYVIAGVRGSKGTLKNEGKITIPQSTWKVAVIMPHDLGLANVVDYRDLEVIAVDMPNEPGVRNVNWQTYETTVDAIEALTGYDLLALLPDKVENAVESNTKPPLAVIDGPYALPEGGSVDMSGAGSQDFNGQVVSYSWSFGDGATATGALVNHAYTQDGTYTVTLTVTDNDGLSDSSTTTATVTNVAPDVDELPAATLLPGELYATTAGFTDPGADAWTASVDYGDGGGAVDLPLDGMTFALAHTYPTAGVFTLTVAVSDDDTTSSSSAIVTVLTHDQAIRDAIALVDGLVAAGKLSAPRGASLTVKLAGAIKDLGKGDVAFALDKLRSTVDAIDALVRSGKLAAADAAPVRALIVRIIVSLSR